MDAVDLANPQTLNLYAYCGNDPINNVDPAGLFSFGSLFRAIGGFFFGGGTVFAFNHFPIYQVGGATPGWSSQVMQLYHFFVPQQQKPTPPPPLPVACHEVQGGEKTRSETQSDPLFPVRDILSTLIVLGQNTTIILQHVAPDLIQSTFARKPPPYKLGINPFGPRPTVASAHDSNFLSKIMERGRGNPGPSGAVSSAKFLERNWDRATFGSIRKSIQYHVTKHGKGMSAIEYTQRALKALKDSKAIRSATTDLRGRKAVQVASKYGTGLYTKAGKIIWFHPNR